MEDNNQDLRPYAPCLTLEQHSSSVLGECYLLQAPLGLRPDSYDAVRSFLDNLVSYFIAHRDCTHESYVALHQVRERGVIELFADHASAWLPEAILGVWTHLPAPQMMTAETLMEADPQSRTGSRIHSLFRVTTGAKACLEAMTTMAGTGTSIQIVSQMDSDKLLRNLKDLFLGFIKERIFRIFPWYIPLLSARSLEEPIADLTVQALSDITLYIRESPEDGGILLLAREPLEDVFLQAGCQPIDEMQEIKQWRLPL